MPGFCDALGIVLGRPVSDRTGLAGRFDIHLEFDRDANPDGIEPSIFWAIQQQLGLRLQSHKEPTAVLVIDGLERLPTAN